jgi:hypothetical protein
MTAMELEDVLIDLGFEVDVAHDLPTGVAFFHARSPDLGIFDVHIGNDISVSDRLPLEWATCQIVRKPLNVTRLYAALCAAGFETMVPRQI